MAITLKNKKTNELFDKTKNIVYQDGTFWYFNKARQIGDLWLNRHPMFTQGERVQGSGTNLKIEIMLSDEWELEKSTRTRKPRQPKDAQAAPKQEEPKTPKKEQPKKQPKAQDTSDVEATLLASLKALRGGAVDSEQVRQIFREELAKYAEREPQKVKLAAKKASGKEDEVYCEDFDDIVQDVADGFHVYLYGPAGSGKSHTAEQVAERLGLDFYGQTTIQFAHDVRGYGDASGKYQGTPKTTKGDKEEVLKEAKISDAIILDYYEMVGKTTNEIIKFIEESK